MSVYTEEHKGAWIVIESDPLRDNASGMFEHLRLTLLCLTFTLLGCGGSQSSASIRQALYAPSEHETWTEDNDYACALSAETVHREDVRSNCPAIECLAERTEYQAYCMAEQPRAANEEVEFVFACDIAPIVELDGLRVQTFGGGSHRPGNSTEHTVRFVAIGGTTMTVVQRPAAEYDDRMVDVRQLPPRLVSVACVRALAFDEEIDVCADTDVCGGEVGPCREIVTDRRRFLVQLPVSGTEAHCRVQYREREASRIDPTFSDQEANQFRCTMCEDSSACESADPADQSGDPADDNAEPSATEALPPETLQRIQQRMRSMKVDR